MRIFWSSTALLALIAVEAAAGEYDLAWARLAGEHMGRAEAGAKCGGYKLNAGRRAQILALYKDKRLARVLERERVKVRGDREKAMRGDPDVCTALLDMYGPAGLAIRNYILKETAPDAADQPGIDRGLSFDVDPRGVVAMHWLMLSGYATTIETVCGDGYEMVPLVQGQHYLARQTFGLEGAMTVAAVSIATAGREYRLEEDRPGFCSRILRDYGPASDSPVVRAK